MELKIINNLEELKEYYYYYKRKYNYQGQVLRYCIFQNFEKNKLLMEKSHH